MKEETKAVGTRQQINDIQKIGIIQEICMLTAPMWDRKKKKMGKRMTIIEACEKAGVAPITYHKWLQKDPRMAQFVDELKQSQRIMVADLSESIIFDALNGDTKITANEKIKLAQWTLEKTDKGYNPGQKIEMESKTLNIDMTESEIIARLKELNINQEQYGLMIPEATYVEEPTFSTSTDFGTPTSGGEDLRNECEGT